MNNVEISNKFVDISIYDSDNDLWNHELTSEQIIKIAKEYPNNTFRLFISRENYEF